MALRGRPAADDDDDDDAEDIGQYVVEGKALKKAIMRGRRKPVPFAFCPVAGDETTWFATHKKKPAVRIAKKTRKESGQFKVAYGTYVVEARLLILTCVDTIPELARRVKRHLARENLRFNVRVVGIDGVEIEAAVDDLSGLPDEEDDDDDDDEDDDAAPRGTAPQADDVSHDPLVQRLAPLKAPILAARGLAGDRLRELLAGAQRALDGRDRFTATELVERLEIEVRRLMNSAARPAIGPTATPAPPPPRPKPPVEDDEPDEAEAAEVDRKMQVKLAGQARRLRQRIEALDNAAEDRLLAALAIVERQLADGDLFAAADTVDRVADALDRVEAMKAAGRA